MPFGIFSIYGVLKLPEFLAYDWSIFLCLKPLVTKLDVLCSDMTGPFEAKTEQNINYPADFGSIPCAVGNFFLTETNFRCSVITKLEFRV